MTRSPADLKALPIAVAAPVEPRLHRELPPLVVLAALLALACCGHFVKPHGDFYEFRETGHALLRGELPPTFKRAPVFPLLVAAAGTLLGTILTTQTPPDQLAASWINAALLPCNVALTYLIGRRWFGAGSRWTATWVALLPVGLYCTAHVLVEPLLVGMILLTIWLAGRGSRWAYLTAALASMTRYDAAGLLIGVALADLLGRQRLRVAVTRTALALTPLVLWLALTALTWETRSEDHYLRQIGERWQFEVAWPLDATFRCVFGPETLPVPVWLADWEPWLRGGTRWGIVVAAVLGGGVLLWRRDRAVLGSLTLFVGYILVHAVFPFRSGFERFGYPPAPLVILAAGVGVHFLARWVSGSIQSGAVRGLLLLVVALPLLILAYGEASRLRALLSLPRQWLTSLPVFALAGVTLVWVTSWRGRSNVAGRIVGYLALCLLALVHLRQALPLLGDGRERINDVGAARWIRANTGPEEGVLTDSPGLLRLYADDRAPQRFVGLGGIVAESWPAILAECRRRGICYIIWHDQVFAEQGAYYIRKWRLERFAVLANPEAAPGLVVEMRYEERPTLWILRVLPE
ncbi:MAG: hypothetical protein ACE5I3_10425 [Phycisphaerae bacterium]